VNTTRDHETVLEAIRNHPARILDLVGIPPDPWQIMLLSSSEPRVLGVGRCGFRPTWPAA
jgi:hypothetical protein